MSNVHDIEFGPYRLIINANNSDRGVIPLVNVLRDPKWSFAENCAEYKQVWSGDIVDFYELMEKATTPEWMEK